MIYTQLSFCLILPRQLQSDDPQAEFGVPANILDAWKHAVQSKSRNAKNALFTAFLKSGKNWGQLLAYNLVSPPHTTYPIYHKCVSIKKKVYSRPIIPSWSQASNPPLQEPGWKDHGANPVWLKPQNTCSWQQNMLSQNCGLLRGAVNT